MKTSVLDLTPLQITLRALVERTEGRFLGKPKIMTLNNKTATDHGSTNQATSVEQTSDRRRLGNHLGGQHGRTSSDGHFLEGHAAGQQGRLHHACCFSRPYIDVSRRRASRRRQSRLRPPDPRQDPLWSASRTGRRWSWAACSAPTETKDVRKVPFLGYIPAHRLAFHQRQRQTQQHRSGDLHHPDHRQRLSADHRP